MDGQNPGCIAFLGPVLLYHKIMKRPCTLMERLNCIERPLEIIAESGFRFENNISL